MKGRNIFRKYAVRGVIVQLVLFTIVTIALVDPVVSIGGGTIA